MKKTVKRSPQANGLVARIITYLPLVSAGVVASPCPEQHGFCSSELSPWPETHTEREETSCAYSLLIGANVLETTLSRDRLYSLSGPTRCFFHE